MMESIFAKNWTRSRFR